MWTARIYLSTHRTPRPQCKIILQNVSEGSALTAVVSWYVCQHWNYGREPLDLSFQREWLHSQSSWSQPWEPLSPSQVSSKPQGLSNSVSGTSTFDFYVLFCFSFPFVQAPCPWLPFFPMRSSLCHRCLSHAGLSTSLSTVIRSYQSSW